MGTSSGLLSNFETQLESIESKFLEHAELGISEKEIRSITSEICPQASSVINQDVIAWYGWRNGIDGEKFILLPQDEQQCFGIFPNGCSFYSLEMQLEIYAQTIEIDQDEGLGEFTKPLFPFMQDDIGGSYFLKPIDSDISEIWYYQADEANGPEPVKQQDPSSGPVSFSQWVEATSMGIQDGKFRLGEYGQVEAARYTEDHLEYELLCPWNKYAV